MVFDPRCDPTMASSYQVREYELSAVILKNYEAGTKSPKYTTLVEFNGRWFFCDGELV